MVDLQSPFLASLNTRIVAPLVEATQTGPTHLHLNPQVLFEKTEYVAMVHLMSAVSSRALGPELGSLDNYHDELLRARDYLFDGY